MTVSRKMAVIRRPRTEIDVAQEDNGKEPLKMRNSPGNPLSPGKPSEAKMAMPMSPEKTGTTLRSPPNSSMPRSPPERRSSSARNQKSADAVRRSEERRV